MILKGLFLKDQTGYSEISEFLYPKTLYLDYILLHLLKTHSIYLLLLTIVDITADSTPAQWILLIFSKYADMMQT